MSLPSAADGHLSNHGLGKGSSRPGQIIFVNRFFYPDHSATSELVSDLAFALTLRGFRVAIITSRLRYDATERLLPSHETILGVEVFRVWTSRRGRHRLPGRILDYASFYVMAGLRLWRLARRGDIVVAKTDPPLVSVVAAFVAWLRKAKLVNWHQDIFPEVAEAVGVGGKIGRAAFALVRPLRNWSLRRARFNVAVGNRMAEMLERLGAPPDTIRTIANWSDGKAILPMAPAHNSMRAAWGLDDCFVVGYAGNLGRAHETETILAAMQALQRRSHETADEAEPLIRFLFVGGGALRPKLEEGADRAGLNNVQFHDYQPRDQLSATLGAADVHLVILNPKLEGLIVPSKIYAIAAAGRPAIFIGDRFGEVAKILKETECGFTVEPNDVSELEQRVLQLARSPQLGRLMGNRARATFEQRWDKAIAVASWELLLSELGASDMPPQQDPNEACRPQASR